MRVRRDLEGLTTVTAPGGLVLAHDVYSPQVAAAIAQAVALGGWTDGGIVSTTCNSGVEGGRPATYAGFRLLIRQAPVPRTLPRRIARTVRAVVQRGVEGLRRLSHR